MMPEVSIIIPVYNCQEYISETVSKILLFEGLDYEVILVNDGSQDASGEICSKIAERYENVISVHQVNQGVSSARNHGIRCARGEFLVFADADDAMEMAALNRVIELMRKDNAIDMAAFGMSFDYYHNGKCYRRDELTSAVTGVLTSEVWTENLYELYASNTLSPLWNKVLRRDVIFQNGLELNREMFIYEDLEFSLRYMAYCEKIFFSPEIVYHYRQSEDEGNAGRRLKKIEDLSSIVEKIHEALEVVEERKNAGVNRGDLQRILLTLYLVIAREKIDVSDQAEIGKICTDFIRWYEKQKIMVIHENRDFMDCLLQKKVGKLIIKRTYIQIRHKIAVKVKNSVLYRKIRGLR